MSEQQWTEDEHISNVEMQQDFYGSSRGQMVGYLIAEQVRIEREYIQGTSSRAKYVEEMADLNEKLAIFGLQFILRPWETPTPRPSGTKF